MVEQSSPDLPMLIHWEHLQLAEPPPTHHLLEAEEDLLDPADSPPGAESPVQRRRADGSNRGLLRHVYSKVSLASSQHTQYWPAHAWEADEHCDCYQLHLDVQ